MQWVLGRLKGRLGVAFILASVVLIAVGIGRAIGGDGSDSATDQLGSNVQTPPAAVPSDVEDGVEDGPVIRQPEPSLVAGADEPLKVAGQFLKAWLRSQVSPERWHAGLTPYATSALAEKLSGVDPGSVPAERTTGEAKLVRSGAGAAAVSTPVDSGTVELRLVVVDGEWLVDGVDWSRG